MAFGTSLLPEECVTDLYLVKEKLRKVAWHEIFSENAVNVCYDKLHGRLSDVVNKSIKLGLNTQCT